MYYSENGRFSPVRGLTASKGWNRTFYEKQEKKIFKNFLKNVWHYSCILMQNTIIQ